MRHLWSLMAGVVAAPLAWLLLATGQHRAQESVNDWNAAGAFDTAELIGPAILLVVTGVLLGVLGTLRWSPAGPVAAGLLLVLPTVFMFANPFGVQDAFPDRWRLLGQDFAPRLPIENGTLLVLGTLLLMAAFSLQRWRRWPTAFEPLPPATDDQIVAGMDELTATPSDPPETMTDDEILAAARELEEAEAAPEPATAGPEPDADEPAVASSEDEPTASSEDPPTASSEEKRPGPAGSTTG